jgi:hypothetical protein
MRVFADLPYDEYAKALRLKGSPYAPPEETAEAKPGQARRRRGRR